MSTGAGIDFRNEPSGMLGLYNVVRRFPARFGFLPHVWREITNLDELSLIRFSWSGWDNMQHSSQLANQVPFTLRYTPWSTQNHPWSCQLQTIPPARFSVQWKSVSKSVQGSYFIFLKSHTNQRTVAKNQVNRNLSESPPSNFEVRTTNE